jgi:hypothetical protein
MSGVRLLVTSAAMAAVAAVLNALALDPAIAATSLRDAQHVASTGGPDVVVVAAVSLAAWLAWGWGALGLALTAATVLPGAAGAVARIAVRVLLPAGLRSGAAVAVGIGLVVAAPASAHATPMTTAAAYEPAPDWPTGTPRDEAPVPDWPEAAAEAAPGVGSQAHPESVPHVVSPGDCLWRIASDRLRQVGPPPSDGEIAVAVTSWWSTNRSVIGPDPDLIHPGQVLLPPP